MKIKVFSISTIIAFSVFPAFAQLNGNYSPDLSSLEIPAFDGVVLSETVSATDFSVTMEQLLNSKLVTGAGTLTATDFYASDSLVLDFFEADESFSAVVALRGSIVSLAGAKATLSNATGTGTYTDDYDGATYDVTITSITGSFKFSYLQVNLTNDQISGFIVPGSLKVSGFKTADPSQRGTVNAFYGGEDFGPYAFVGDIISPVFNLALSTSGKGVITGSAVGEFGTYDDVNFTVKGKRNSKTGLNSVTLTSANPKGISAVLNLDNSGETTGSANLLKVLGYTLKF